MRSATITLACAVVALLGWAGIACAQKSTGPGAGYSPFTPSTSGGCGPQAGSGSPACDTALMKQWEYYRDVPFQLGEHAHQGKEWDKEFARKESQKIIEALSLPCELADAERAGGGKIQVDGRLLDVKVYEAACRSGTGYFLVSQPPQKSLAISCFAAEAARAGDVAQGVKPDDFTCTLTGHQDVKTMAASVLNGAGTICDVSDYRWVGVSSVNGTEYSEVACAAGEGYVLEVPQVGPTAQVSVVGCQDAVKEGIKCTLTAVTMPVTLQTFRDVLKDHAVDCEPAQIRYIGRETKGRRYVVELQCPQQPAGLVAFIPLEGNPKPFETLDCSAALARAVQCKLTAKQ
jgi:hypothetical protein